MDRLIQIVTSVVFAAHALLGCGVHHSCQHNPAIEVCAAAHVRSHDCASHHDGESQESSDDHSPAEPCQHVSCSFVKAETVQLEQSAGHVEWIVPVAPSIELTATSHRFLTANGPLCSFDLNSTPLFVWHCALVI